MAEEEKVKVKTASAAAKARTWRVPYVDFLYKIALIIIVAVVGIAVWMIITVISNSTVSGSINKSDYQAVFLTNGQAYFGKIKGINPNFVKITDIYYLQAQQSVQPGSTNQSTNLTLVKLGNEIHGPEDQMYISRQQVLFWENLKSSSKVVQAIIKNQGH